MMVEDGPGWEKVVEEVCAADPVVAPPAAREHFRLFIGTGDDAIGGQAATDTLSQLVGKYEELKKRRGRKPKP